MKAVILAGGYGTRLSEETTVRPKPMVEIGGKPILWHIMKIFSSYGINDFIICCGYKGYMIKEYFSRYFLQMSDITFDMKDNKMHVHTNGSDPWKVTLVDTGEKTMTGGRLKRVRDYIGKETFCFTYGDGVSDIDLGKLCEFHKNQKTHATLTAVQPPGRFGILSLEKDRVVNFREKPQGDGAWINGGFFVLEPAVMDYIGDDTSVWEQDPLRRLAQDEMLSAYRHYGFWHPMDTLRDKHVLEEMWESGKAPWKKW
ncbi:MAG: glucose-1-phosphate cytidylyltransferase [Nitrospirota bacterium]|nr:glucose-1-phosphate cytidylyltransferase [Nitrospirota bacterium]